MGSKGIRRGTTPLHTFHVNVPKKDIDQVEVTYAQQGRVKIRKTQESCTVEEGTIKVLLTQEETFRLSCDALVDIQLRIKRVDGTVTGSKPQEFPVLPCLSMEVL